MKTKKSRAKAKAERERRRLLSAAFHEAGHSVIAWVNDCRVHNVHIRYDDTIDPERPHTLEMISEGQTSISQRLNHFRENEEAMIMILMAGSLAQTEHDNGRPTLRRMSLTDMEPIEQLVERNSGVLGGEGGIFLCGELESCRKAYLDWLRKRTVVELLGNWSKVEAVAKALVEERELSEERFYSIMKEPETAVAS